MDQERLARLGRNLGASPAEVFGLLLLFVVGVAVLGVFWWWDQSGSGTGPVDDGSVAATNVILEDGPITVHVAGEVRNPGIVELKVGDRVADALAAAGGASPGADLDALNLARLLTDGERILVPLWREGGADDPDGSSRVAGQTGAWRADGRLDLNLATASDLEQLPGIGPVLASRIIAHRDEHGPFSTAGALREVSGIGEKSFQALADLVVV